MLNYNDRLNEAWNKVPEQHKKQLLEEMEHKAYTQDFQSYDDSYNVIEILVNAVIDVIKTIFK